MSLNPMKVETGWAIIGHSANEDISYLYDKLRTYGIKPKEFMLYGDIRTFVRANELPENEAIAFHHGLYVGGIDNVDTYINELKRTLGE